MIINEFLNINNDFLDKVKEFIYFDEIWKFPEYNLKDHLGIDDDNFFKIGLYLVKVLNDEHVSVGDFEIRLNKILK